MGNRMSGPAGALPAVLLLAGVLLAAGDARAANADAGVGKKLSSQELKYEIDGDGDYKLLFATEGERSQIVWVRSPTETLGGMRIREVLSVGGKLPKSKDMDQITAQAVLTSGAMLKSGTQKLGGWVLKTSGEDSVFYYVAQVPADLGAEDLATVARAVARSGDEFETMFEAIMDLDKKDTY